MTKKTGHTKWYLYVFAVAFAVYWASNLVLWFPWSIDSRLGITLMLTVNPVLWGWAAYSCLVRLPYKNLMKGSLFTSIILLFTAAVLDYLFFGLIRNATEELYHPTTFFGYGFVLILPFAVSLIFRRRIRQNQKAAHAKGLFLAGTYWSGLFAPVVNNNCLRDKCLNHIHYSEIFLRLKLIRVIPPYNSTF